jgi:hypothetical protein
VAEAGRARDLRLSEMELWVENNLCFGTDRVGLYKT